MTTLSVALLTPWASGALLVMADGRRRLVAWSAVAALTATLAVLAVLAVRVVVSGPQEVVTGGWPAGIGIVLRADALGLTFALVSVLVLLAAAAHEAVLGPEARTFPALLVLLTAGLTGLFLTGDVFSFYVFFEIAMTASYALTTYGGEARQLRAAVVFAAVNLLGSFIFLMSVAGLYHVTGALGMADVAGRMSAVGANAGLLVAVGFFVAFSVKLGLFPFHYWLPTVYAGSRPAVAAVLSGAVANIGGYGLLRFGAGVFHEQLRLASTALVLLGVASIVYGGVLAVSRGDAAEMLAYSAIGQVGYVLVALGVGGPVGLAAAVVYSVINALNKGLLFLTTALRGRLVAAAFVVGALSVAGVPPALGFIGKLELFQTAVSGPSAVGNAALVVLLLAGSALSLVYMFQTYQRQFWREDPSGGGVPSPLPTRAVVAVLALVVLGLAAWPQPLLVLSEHAVEALSGRQG
jgi:multicomponent Na+:H+ antiporter subunit D